jgi:hypothetical protein
MEAADIKTIVSSAMAVGAAIMVMAWHGRQRPGCQKHEASVYVLRYTCPVGMRDSEQSQMLRFDQVLAH